MNGSLALCIIYSCICAFSGSLVSLNCICFHTVASHWALDGVPVKVSEKSLPPKKVRLHLEVTAPCIALWGCHDRLAWFLPPFSGNLAARFWVSSWKPNRGPVYGGEWEHWSGTNTSDSTGQKVDFAMHHISMGCECKMWYHIYLVPGAGPVNWDSSRWPCYPPCQVHPAYHFVVQAERSDFVNTVLSPPWALLERLLKAFLFSVAFKL